MKISAVNLSTYKTYSNNFGRTKDIQINNTPANTSYPNADFLKSIAPNINFRGEIKDREYYSRFSLEDIIIYEPEFVGELMMHIPPEKLKNELTKVNKHGETLLFNIIATCDKKTVETLFSWGAELGVSDEMLSPSGAYAKNIIDYAKLNKDKGVYKTVLGYQNGRYKKTNHLMESVFETIKAGQADVLEGRLNEIDTPKALIYFLSQTDNDNRSIFQASLQNANAADAVVKKIKDMGMIELFLETKNSEKKTIMQKLIAEANTPAADNLLLAVTKNDPQSLQKIFKQEHASGDSLLLRAIKLGDTHFINHILNIASKQELLWMLTHKNAAGKSVVKP